MLSDLKFALRQLLKSPGFSVVAVSMLALGIGANTAIFSFINAFFLKALGFRDVGELVAVYTVDERNPGMLPTSNYNFRDYQEQNQVFSEMAASTFVGVNAMIDQQPSQVVGEVVSGNYFDLLGVRPALGRTFYREEYQKDGTHPVVVLSHGFWQTRLGGRPDIVGRSLLLNGTGFTIVGVAPVGFKGVGRLNNPNFWAPMTMHPVLFTGITRDFYTTRRALIMNVVARLKPGISRAQAESSLKPIAQQLAKDYPVDNTGRSLRLLPLAEATINPAQRQNFVLAGTLLLSLSGIVLLITCANLANLLLARAAARQREIALRIALGAERMRVIRQLLTESLLLAGLGGLAGIAIAYWTKDLLWALRPQGLPADFVVDLDARVLGFALGLSLLTGVLFGLAPAWTSTKPDLVGMLKEGTKGTARTPLFGFRNFLVALQVALSVVALVVAGLFLRSLQHAQSIDPGWNAKNLAMLSFNLSSNGYNETRGHEYFRRVIERAKSIPGVTGASVATLPLMTGGGALRTVRPQGNDDKLRTLGRLMTYSIVTPEYHRFMGLPFAAGREFTAADDDQHPPVVIINQAFADLAWPKENPLGKTIKLFNSETSIEVVGVLKNTLYHNLGEDPALPVLFLPMRQFYQSFAVLHVRTAGDAAAMLPTLQKELQSLDPTLPFIRPGTMDDNLRQALWGPRTGAALLSVFGLLALLLASLGVYAIMSYTVGQRTREIGIRMAIGAQASDVLGMILGRGLVVAGIGLALGLGVAFGVTRYFRDLLLGVSTADPVTYALIATLLLLVALFACWLPARRAARVNPLTALRTE